MNRSESEEVEVEGASTTGCAMKWYLSRRREEEEYKSEGKCEKCEKCAKM